MAKNTTPKSQLLSSLSNLKAGQVAALARIGSLETTTGDFGKVFRENPAAALAAKGIVLDDAAATKLNREVAGIVRPGASAAGEVEVSVKVKF